MSLQVVFDMRFTWSYVRGSKADLRNIKASWSWFGSDAFAFVSPQKTKSSQRPLGLFKEYKFMIHDGSYLRIFPLHSHIWFLKPKWFYSSWFSSRSMTTPSGTPGKCGRRVIRPKIFVFHDLYMVPPFDHVHTRTDHAMLHMDICVHNVYHHSRKSCPVIWNDRWHTAYWQEGVSLYGYPLTFIQIADTSCRASCHVQTYPIPQRNIPQTSNS